MKERMTSGPEYREAFVLAMENTLLAGKSTDFFYGCFIGLLKLPHHRIPAVLRIQRS
jgi:hypothetical protein